MPTTARSAPTVPAALASRPGRRRRPVRRPALSALALGMLVTVAACGNGGDDTPATSAPSTSSLTPSTPASTTGSPTASSPSPSRSATAVPPAPTTRQSGSTQPASCVDRAVSAMSRAQQVGQLFMTAVTSTGMTSAEVTAISRGRVGSVILITHTSGGTSVVKPVTDRVQTLAPTVKGARVRMLVSTDQEGGQVQVLNGPGFSAIPSAVTQGQWSASRLKSSAAQWGRQLKAAGVNMNLAPVGDTVPPDLVNVNAPIGRLDREFGTNPSTVATHSTAFLNGMLQAGVVPTVKHFPGLGRVTGNTDLSADVVDGTTTRTDPFLQPFRSAIQAGVPFVMVSSAKYSRIDAAHQAAFSPAVMRLLRDTLGFKGAIISDDLGKAVAVSDHTPAQRAVDFLAAGGTMVLTVTPADIVPMTSAVISRMATNTAFRTAVNDSVHRVLTAKRNAGLLTCG
ncbi:glycoside hydrolase family 3 protein [Streptomyces sp. NBC_01476]|uniref:glycoside hydrolase family 3 N-terminal domain-containing protein n=1 Tax=Streptomyces sp. NBC_01476 TaxID=2903881 RepID=UPI002E32F12B|nr:glycoside hydrolase family 3 N-terminal domain-containing protein [Streptomyces sp. NBC_01476]